MCVKREAELSNDYHLVLCKWRLALSSRIQRIDQKKQNRIRWEALADEAVRRNFAGNIDQRCSRLPSKETNVETEWSLFRITILSDATETCGVQHIRPPIGQKKTSWWNDEVPAVVVKKKAAFTELG